MTEDQIKHMTNRFLQWKLPETFNPDAGISYQKLPSPHQGPTGTNLLDAKQAEEMVKFMTEGLPTQALNEERVRGVQELLDVYAPDTFDLEMAASITSRALNGA